MSATAYHSVYGTLTGREAVEAGVLRTLAVWIVPYVAEYERQHGLPARSTPTPPSTQSVRGGIDFTSFEQDVFPVLIAVVQPVAELERLVPGEYGAWFEVQVGAIVQVEGDQDATRRLAGIYGTCLQGILAQQGAFGLQADGVTPLATRTRLWTAAGIELPDPSVRDIVRATVGAHTFVEDLVSDLAGPTEPPRDPYAVPGSGPLADRVEVDLVRGTPDTSGPATADAVVLDETVNPPVTRLEVIQVVATPPTTH